MKNCAILTLTALSLLATKSFAQEGTLTAEMPAESRSLQERNSALEYDWKAGLSGQNSNGESGQSKLIDFRVAFKVNYKLNSSLSMDASPILKFQSGTQQTLNAADTADNRILLGQAALHYSPFSALSLSAGALNQGYFHSSLMVDEIPFPAARVEIGKREGFSRFSLIAETAIPTSSSLSTNTNEMEATPSLNSAALRFALESSRHQYWRTTAGYFAYSQLPSSVAAQSYLLGNSVQKISDTEGSFLYRYQGLEAKSEGRWAAFHGVDLFAAIDYLQNTKAPSGLNRAYQYFAGTEFFFKKSISWSLGAGYFHIEPDATVAYFSANRYFNTNRVGYYAESYLNFHKDSFRLGLRYTEAEVMFESPVQSRERSVLLRLETSYADI